MRVYGSSPLFNYVELIFRSKRLFIVSIILATLATSGFYFSRSKNYTARMAVLMTGALGSSGGRGRFAAGHGRVQNRGPQHYAEKPSKHQRSYDYGKLEREHV